MGYPTDPKTKPYLRVEMPDGSLWGVPLHVIANDRAGFYEKKEPGAFNDEFQYTMTDSYQAIDWAQNNMCWKQLEAHAFKIEEAPVPDYDEGLMNGAKKIILPKADTV